MAWLNQQLLANLLCFPSSSSTRMHKLQPWWFSFSQKWVFFSHKLPNSETLGKSKSALCQGLSESKGHIVTQGAESVQQVRRHKTKTNAPSWCLGTDWLGGVVGWPLTFLTPRNVVVLVRVLFQPPWGAPAEHQMNVNTECSCTPTSQKRELLFLHLILSFLLLILRLQHTKGNNRSEWPVVVGLKCTCT